MEKLQNKLLKLEKVEVAGCDVFKNKKGDIFGILNENNLFNLLILNKEKTRLNITLDKNILEENEENVKTFLYFNYSECKYKMFVLGQSKYDLIKYFFN